MMLVSFGLFFLLLLFFSFPLIVISDGLSVSGSKARSSTSLRLSEGDSFKLRCSAITTSPEHTHLHVTWQLRSSGSSWRDILSLTHEGKFQPGPGYEERYRSGDVRLDTGANDTYRLSVSQASSADGGAYRCLVSEWVRGADGSWQKIQEKSVEIATVSIQRTGECSWWAVVAARGCVQALVLWGQLNQVRVHPAEPGVLFG